MGLNLSLCRLGFEYGCKFESPNIVLRGRLRRDSASFDLDCRVVHLCAVW